ncbi:MAG: DUF2225 domain-containing protein [Bacillota bacterium]|nr:DUF2225 domain-containing protein [Bacillota bacterium]
MVDVHKLAQIGIAKRYQTDEVIFDEGDAGEEMFILLTGRVGVYRHSVDGHEVQLAELTPGSFFGEMSLLEKQPRNATVKALDETIVVTLNQNNFEEVIAQQPQLAFRIMQGMSHRIRLQNEQLATLMQKDSEEPPETENDVCVSADKDLPMESKQSPVVEKSENTEMLSSEKDDYYLFDKEITCPVCNNTFSVKMVRSSRLRLNAVESDLRQRFANFEPLWYMVWICPNCSFANFNYEFKQLSDEQKKFVLSNSKDRKQKYTTSFSHPRKLGEVLNAYFLVLDQLMAQTQPDSGRIAKVWLRLSWLYQDADDNENYLIASQNALEFFCKMYYQDGKTRNPDEEQRLALVLGELYFRLQQYKEAGEFFRRAIVHRGGNATINRQAEDRIQELKDIIQAVHTPTK